MKGLFFKLGLWAISLFVLAFVYETMRGHSEYRRLRKQLHKDYPDLAQQLQPSPEVPAEQNFFLAPELEKYYLKRSEQRELAFNGLGDLHLENWAKALPVSSSPISPAALLQLPHAPPSPTNEDPAEAVSRLLSEGKLLSDLTAALVRPHAAFIPTAAERNREFLKHRNVSRIRIPHVSRVFAVSEELTARTKLASAAGLTDLASRFIQIHLRLAEAGMQHGWSLVESLVGLAIAQNLVEEALPAALAANSVNRETLEYLQQKLSTWDEDATVLDRSMNREFFLLHTLTKEEQATLFEGSDPYSQETLKLASGIWEANLATHLEWGMRLIVPNGPGDDLRALHDRLETHSGPMREAMSQVSHRNFFAAIALPAMSGIPSRAESIQRQRRAILQTIKERMK